MEPSPCLESISHLIDENEKLHNVINLVNDPLFVKDNNHRILHANPAFFEMFCLEEKDILGKTLVEEVPETEQVHFLSIDRAVLDTGISNICEEELTVKGQTHTIITGKSRFINNKNERFLVGSIHDITSLKRSENIIIEKNAELELLNLSKNKFFTIIAHDLKSPFATINGFCNILLDHIKKDNLEGIAEYADIILQSSTRAMNLLMNLSEWSRSQTGRMDFNPEYLNTEEVIQENVLLYQPIATNKGIQIDVIPTLNKKILADKSMLNTIFRNLISNAIKFTNPNGIITITTQTSDTGLIFVVKDSGIGIPPQILKTIFQIDNKHSTIGTQNEKGTGLGLILCKEFIEKHQGTIWAESVEGKGSTFYFLIPDR